MSKYIEYKDKLTYIAADIIRNTPEDIQEIVKRNIAISLFGRDGEPVYVEMNEYEKHFYILFYGLHEIIESYDLLKDFEIFIKVFPYNRYNISKARYLRFIIGTYLNEMYIFKERLVAYIKTIEKEYRSTRRYLDVKGIINPLYHTVISSLNNICEVRNSHVHVNRYYDNSINRVIGFELVTQGDNTGTFYPRFEREYKKIRSEWKKTIKENNRAVNELLDYVSAELMDIVFKNNSEINHPSEFQ
jgi:hypothetical protein